MSTFSTIQTATSGLQAQQAAIDIAGQNVTNVATPGYHRQEAVLQTQTTNPLPGTIGTQLGAGVEVSSIRRMQSNFLQQQYRLSEGQIGYWTAAQQSLQEIQSAVSPSSGSTLSSALDSFFGAYQQLATNPQDTSQNAGVLSAATQLSSVFNSTSAYLSNMKSTLSGQLNDQTSQLNDFADQLAKVNAQISSFSAAGQNTNSLLDTRDTLLSQIGGLVGVSTNLAADGSAMVSVGGHSLVQGNLANHVQVASGATGLSVNWDDGTAVNTTNGGIAASLQMTNNILPNYQNQLDTIAYAVSSSVNNLQQTGVTSQNTPAGPLFTGTNAATLQVSSTIQNDSGAIAASTATGQPGGLAGAIAALAQQPLVGSQTLNQSAQGMIGQIGNAVNGAQTSLSANQALHDQLTTQDQQTSGVSLDEELSNMLMYQRAYEASAQVLRTSDEMITTLLGIVR